VGTLTRRIQWQGAVDHLDETAAESERELVGHLLRSLVRQTHLFAPSLASAPR
jgi:hypothetical protein